MIRNNAELKELRDKIIAYIGTTIIVSFIIGMFMFCSGKNVPNPLFDIHNRTGEKAMLILMVLTVVLILLYILLYLIKRSGIIAGQRKDSAT